jgi:hypothetical protein
MGHMGTIVLLVLMGITAIVLVIGLLLMARGGEANRKYSNKLMVMRVVFQALAIGVIALLLVMKGKG